MRVMVVLNEDDERALDKQQNGYNQLAITIFPHPLSAILFSWIPSFCSADVLVCRTVGPSISTYLFQNVCLFVIMPMPSAHLSPTAGSLYTALFFLGSGPKEPMSCRTQGWISRRPDRAYFQQEFCIFSISCQFAMLFNRNLTLFLVIINFPCYSMENIHFLLFR